MKTVLFLIAFAVPAARASILPPNCKHTSQTAQKALSAVYAGEKAFHQEKKTYSEDFGDIGYDPNMIMEDEADCDMANWVFEIDRGVNTNGFTARAYSRITGEELSINEKKEIGHKDDRVSAN